jgi:Nuclear transport factor 2 (NTF2) domain
MSAEDVATAFINHYYSTVDSNPAALAGLYQPNSTLTFEGAKFTGPEAIVGKYMVIANISYVHFFPLKIET